MLGNSNNRHGDVELCHLAMMQISKEKELGEEE
jgi:hypothetical protein